MYKVYVLINKVNNKMYVGSTERSLKIRLLAHFSKANEDSQCTLHKAIRKYSKNNFDIRMIEEYFTREAMLDDEVIWIAYFNTYKSFYGYNDTAGGDGGNTNGGKKFNNDWVVGISKSLAGKPQISRRRFSEEIEKEICKLYVEKEKSTYVLANQFNCGRNTIADIIKRYNIATRQSNYTGHSNGCNIFSLKEEMEICSQYLLGNISRSGLAKKYNCGKTTIRDILLKYKIKL